MSERTFHHGNLRAALLDEAEEALRDGGVDALSLRQLAKTAGVSHSAPRRHFPDRQALLVALAERGFARLAEEMRRALEAPYDDDVQRFRGVARVFVDHAARHPRLVELMFTVRPDGEAPGLEAAAATFFVTVQDALGGDPSRPGALRRQLLVAATLQGIATFVTDGRIDARTADDLIEDAADLFTP